MTVVALNKAALPTCPASPVGMPLQSFELRPHRSLTAAGARLFLMSVAAVSLGASSIIALRGAWPALVFSGIVIFAIYLALRASMRAREDSQEIHITEHKVQLFYIERSHVSAVTLPRCWTRVRLHPSHTTRTTSTLCVESAGRYYEIGSFLTETERRDLEAQLRRLIGGMGAMPSLTEPSP
jgi:uncharacterized membrane protein